MDTRMGAVFNISVFWDQCVNLIQKCNETNCSNGLESLNVKDKISFYNYYLIHLS